ncbi:vitamin B12 dependent-methionine synthase activation domain-containing protein [Candidatus Thiosymbion oneisti]|uniref:vitamin B12 dependent-methionine synthase activation domain-containing protein n=1 Tax=Candidatus Thiosymbion oneisti TaxID=589554 RepID=UPI000B800363|nr:vitamin B12 dependent-methionine synthase activation domain-containing protein [Candidatus Thiosymbion oneisti]
MPNIHIFSHPDARYFTVDKLGKDQIRDYAERKDQPLSETERWLGPNLAHEPDRYESNI